MKRVSLILLAIIFTSCSSNISEVEKMAVEYFKSETLDPQQFEIIKIETVKVTERDLKIKDLKQSIQEEEKRVKNWKILEEFKSNPESGSIYGVSNYDVVYGDSFDDTNKKISQYKSEHKRRPETSYTRQLKEDLLLEISAMQRLFCSEPESGQKKIQEYKRKITILNGESENSPVSRYEVKLRFYAMNRLGTRGITDASIEIYSDQTEGFILGLPEYSAL